MGKFSRKPYGSNLNMESEREIQVFNDITGAIQEAEYCSKSEKRNYAIIQWGGYFGVLPKAHMLKDDVLYETIISPAHIPENV